MANDRATVAERVLTILEPIRAQRQSGRLVIGQYNGGRIQEGEIYFQAGEPVYARLGQLVGQDALNRLLTWRNIQFTLYLDDGAYATTQPGPAVTTSRQAALPMRSSASPLPVNTPVPPITSSPLPIAPPTTPSPAPRENSNLPGLEWLVPRKSHVARDVMSLPLTRPQRFTYFLVDGRRTIADLSRCTGKTVQELDLILSELRAQGLVEI